VTARSSSGGKLHTAAAPSTTKTGLQPYRYAFIFMTDEAVLHFLFADRFLHRDEKSNGSLAKQFARTNIFQRAFHLVHHEPQL
jgi:hypothetical protein